jgi:hypothetical protein
MQKRDVSAPAFYMPRSEFESLFGDGFPDWVFRDLFSNSGSWDSNLK